MNILCRKPGASRALSVAAAVAALTLCLGLAGLDAPASAATGTAGIYVGPEKVLTPPGLFIAGIWRQHFAYSGHPVLLKGVLQNAEISTTYTYEWDFGDGTSSGPIAVVKPWNLPAFHTYANTAPGTSYTAVLKVMKGATEVGRKNYLITYYDGVNQDVRLAVAIEDGLWYLNRRMDRADDAGVKLGLFGNDGENAIALLAFLYHGHKATAAGGDPEDPYTENVDRILNFVLSRTSKQTIGSPYDTNSNGYGLYNISQGSVVLGNASLQPLATGLLVAALSQPGAANHVSPAGIAEVQGHPTQDLIPEFLDYLFWSQVRSGGSSGAWGTTPAGPSAMTQTGWVGVGLGFEKASGVVPLAIPVVPSDWKTLISSFVSSVQNANGSLGDTAPFDLPNFQSTAAGIPSLFVSGAPVGDARLSLLRQWLTLNWNAATSSNRHFGDLRAMGLLALGSDFYGITDIGGHNWKSEYANWLINNQNSDQSSFFYGSWNDLSSDGAQYNPQACSPASTSWGLLLRRDLQPPCFQPSICVQLKNVLLTCFGTTALIDASCTTDTNVPPLPIDTYEFKFCDGSVYTETAASAPDGAFDGKHTATVCVPGGAQTCWVEVRAKNSCGIWSNVQRVDITCPQPQNPTSRLKVDCLTGKAQLDASASTDPLGLGIVRYTFYFGDGSPAYTETPASFPDGKFDGKYLKICSGPNDTTAEVEVENCLGLVSPRTSITYLCCVCDQPICDVKVTPAVIASGGQICVDASASRDTNVPAKPFTEYKFTLCNGATYTETPANAPDGTFDGKHCFTTPDTCLVSGSCSVTAKVTTGCGFKECTAQFTVNDCNHKPDAKPGGPYVACINTKFKLNGCASTDPDAGDSISNYKWTITPAGKNTPAVLTGCEPEVSFSEPGIYNVCLEVQDQTRSCCLPSPLWSLKACTTIEIKENAQIMEVTPETAVNLPGQPHDVQICIKDCNGNGVSGVPIDVTVEGTNSVVAHVQTGPSGCVTWTYVSQVEGDDRIIISGPNGLIRTVQKLWRRTPPGKIYQAYPGMSVPLQPGWMGYQGLSTEDVIQATPGVLRIIPGENWSNFMQAPNGVIKTVQLLKEAPETFECPDVFVKHTIVQSGNNIRLVWPLLYEAPGTRFTITVVYGTPTAVQLPGEAAPSTVHTSIFTYEVDVDIDHLIALFKMFHTIPCGKSETPLISDEDLYQSLLQHLLDAKKAFDQGDLAGMVSALASFELEMDGRCVYACPGRPAPRGEFLGIIQTMENPVCCKLTVDSEYLIRKYGNP